MTSAAARNLPELLVHSPGVREGIPLLGGSISRSSGAATELPRALAPPESARAHRSAQMARARRPEARGDPSIAIGSCSNFAARPAGVKLRARLPSQRVGAHNLPRHRLALSGRGRSAASRAGGHGPCWSHGAVRPRCAAAAITRSHPASRHAHSRSQLSSLDRGPPSAAAPLPAGDAMTVEHRERARTRRRFHDADARARRGARGARRPASRPTIFCLA